MATAKSKSTTDLKFEFEVKEFEFPESEQNVSVYKLNDNIIIHDSENNVTLNIDDLIETLEELSYSSKSDSLEHKASGIACEFFKMLQHQLVND